MCRGGNLQVWQQQVSRKQQIGYPCVLPIKTKNAINMIIKAFTKKKICSLPLTLTLEILQIVRVNRLQL